MPISKLIYSENENQFLKNIGFRIQFECKKANLSQEQSATLKARLFMVYLLFQFIVLQRL